MTSAKCAPSDAPIKENASILAGFAQKGTDLSRKREVEFLAEFQNPDHAASARTQARELLKAQNYSDFLFGICRDDEEETYELRLSVIAVPSVSLISDFEHSLGVASTAHNGSEVSWIFAA
ncbi:MAG: ribonuclease E inhibitor RraB [Paracoccaceae bacterium]|nr:ribonuclease E inhibitor RraB [Paracoccaceae bacterium]